MHKRQRRRQRKVDLGKKCEDLFQEELESKKARSSGIKPEEGQEDEEFEETNHESIFLTPPTDHSATLKGNQNSLQQKGSGPTTSFASLTPLLHLSYPQQQEL